MCLGIVSITEVNLELIAELAKFIRRIVFPDEFNYLFSSRMDRNKY